MPGIHRWSDGGHIRLYIPISRHRRQKRRMPNDENRGVIAGRLVFEWDENKRLSNVEKHGLDLRIASMCSSIRSPSFISLPGLRLKSGMSL